MKRKNVLPMRIFDMLVTCLQTWNENLETLCKLKAHIALDIDREITPQLQSFRSFDIQKRVRRVPSMASSDAPLLFPPNQSMTNSSTERSYLSRVCKAITAFPAQLWAILSFQEETELLRELHCRLKLYAAALSEAQSRQTVSQQEADAYQAIFHDAVNLRYLLYTQTHPSTRPAPQYALQYISKL